jgi:hypothetical protein
MISKLLIDSFLPVSNAKPVVGKTAKSPQQGTLFMRTMACRVAFYSVRDTIFRYDCTRELPSPSQHWLCPKRINDDHIKNRVAVMPFVDSNLQNVFSVIKA